MRDKKKSDFFFDNQFFVGGKKNEKAKEKFAQFMFLMGFRVVKFLPIFVSFAFYN